MFAGRRERDVVSESVVTGSISSLVRYLSPVNPYIMSNINISTVLKR